MTNVNWIYTEHIPSAKRDEEEIEVNKKYTDNNNDAVSPWKEFERTIWFDLMSQNIALYRSLCPKFLFTHHV